MANIEAGGGDMAQNGQAMQRRFTVENIISHLRTATQVYFDEERRAKEHLEHATETVFRLIGDAGSDRGFGRAIVPELQRVVDEIRNGQEACRQAHRRQMEQRVEKFAQYLLYLNAAFGLDEGEAQDPAGAAAGAAIRQLQLPEDWEQVVLEYRAQKEEIAMLRETVAMLYQQQAQGQGQM